MSRFRSFLKNWYSPEILPIYVSGLARSTPRSSALAALPDVSVISSGPYSFPLRISNSDRQLLAWLLAEPHGTCIGWPGALTSSGIER